MRAEASCCGSCHKPTFGRAWPGTMCFAPPARTSATSAVRHDADRAYGVGHVSVVGELGARS